MTHRPCHVGEADPLAKGRLKKGAILLSSRKRPALWGKPKPRPMAVVDYFEFTDSGLMFDYRLGTPADHETLNPKP